MATTRETEYKGKRITLTAARQGPRYVGTYQIHAEPVITGSGADGGDEEVALDNAESAAKQQLDLLSG